jgi:hypothetical protein
MAIEHLTGIPCAAERRQPTQSGPSLVEFLDRLRDYFHYHFNQGQTVDQIFDGLTESYLKADAHRETVQVGRDPGGNDT